MNKLKLIETPGKEQAPFSSTSVDKACNRASPLCNGLVALLWIGAFGTGVGAAANSLGTFVSDPVIADMAVFASAGVIQGSGWVGFSIVERVAGWSLGVARKLSICKILSGGAKYAGELRLRTCLCASHHSI